MFAAPSLCECNSHVLMYIISMCVCLSMVLLHLRKEGAANITTDLEAILY